MKPTVGRIVHYRMPQYAATLIKQRRIKDGQRGNDVVAGQVYPLLITVVWGDDTAAKFNGTVFLDGPDTWWVCSTCLGADDGECSWPLREG
jgi:hypothetical protein